jgi:hypothetical protein
MSAAIDAANLAIRTANNASAEASYRKCTEVLATYDPRSATVEQAREYAGCVYTVHGTGEAPDKTFIAMLLLFVLIGAGIGAYMGDRIGDSRSDAVFGGILGAVMGFPALMVLAGLAYAVSALLS